MSTAPLKRLVSCERQASRGGVPYVGLEHVESGTGKLLMDWIPETVESPSGLDFRPNDVLFGKLRPYLAKSFLAQFQGCCSSEFLVLRPKSPLESRFLSYIVQTQPFIEWANTTSDGAKMPRSDWEALGAFDTWLPSPAGQTAIADFLDAETAELERIVTAKERMIELLAMRWRSMAAQRIASLMNSYGSIPLKRLTECLDSRRIPLSAEERANRRGPYPYYGASAVVDYIDDYIFNEPLVLVGEDGAQLGEPGYPIAERVEGKVWVNNHAHVLRSTGVDPDLLVLHLNTFDRVPFMSGSTREKITQDDLGRIPCPNLPVDDQRHETAEIVAARDQCTGTIGLLTRQIGLLAERRHALITAAVTDQLAIPGAA